MALAAVVALPSSLRKVPIILLKMTCNTCRNVLNKMLSIYGVSIVLCFIKILTLAKQKFFLKLITSLILAHAHNNEICPTFKSKMEDDFSFRYATELYRIALSGCT